MKRYDTMRCSNAEDVRAQLRNLNAAGFHAVVGGDGLTITITEVPDTRYLLQAWSATRTQHTYCDTLEEAEEIAQAMFGAGFEYAEICEGYPGEWTPIKRIKRKGGEV